MTPESSLACPACASREHRLRFARGRHVIVRCERCGLHSALPRPNPEMLRAIYRDASYFAGDAYYLDYLGHRHNYERLARRVVARVLRHRAPPGIWFDVGAAAGFQLEVARRAGFETRGVEPCAAMAAHAQEEGLDVTQGELETTPLPHQTLHVVSFLDSLEHFLDPRHAVRLAFDALDARGVIVVQTPNVGSPAARLLAARWPHYTPPEHLFYFTRTSLTLLLERSGFRLLELSSLGHYFSLRELSRRLLGLRLDRAPLADHSVYLNSGDLFAIACKR
ncbi:MAG: methyltransferase domain-containing protein [Polyangiaceae bacterium]